MPGYSPLVDIEDCKIKVETEKAWLLRVDRKEVWIPKSQAEDNGDGTFTMREWLAKEKGLI
jgi:hypothetical protein